MPQRIHRRSPPTSARHEASRRSGRTTRRERRALRLWRTRSPQDIGPSDRVRLAAALTSTAHGTAAGLRHPCSDSALTIRSAIEILVRRADLNEADADFIMSSLLLHALSGDATSPFILAHALERIERQSVRHSRYQDLSPIWRRWRSASRTRDTG